MATQNDEQARGRGNPPGGGGAAEGTHYRPSRVPGTGESRRLFVEPYHQAGAKSIRLGVKAKHGSLAVKIVVPVILCLAAALAVAGVVILRESSEMQLDALKREAANSSYTLGVLGRVLITQRARFLAANPDYASAAEWPAGNYWLVANGLVPEDEWVKATGFGLKEYAPIEVLERTAERLTLADISRWMESQPAGADIVGVYILDDSGSAVASVANPAFRHDLAQLRSSAAGEAGTLGQTSAKIDYFPDFEPRPVVRGVAAIMSGPEGGARIGTAVVFYRTGALAAADRLFLTVVAGVFLAILAFMAAVTLAAARRAVTPVRQLAADMQTLAMGDYEHRSSLATAPDDIGLLAVSFNSMAERLRVAIANEKETSRLESDMTTARDIQSNLLPLQTPRVRGFDIHTSYRPAREIGGDYYDFLPVDSQHMGIVIADASGKSIPAALVMSTTRAILRFVAPGNLSAADTLTRVNAILSVDIPKGRFVTAYYVILDPVDGSMLCASAGHNPLLIARADGSVELMNPGGIALGFDRGPTFAHSIREEKVKLARGDRVLMYTDGVVECANAANEEYSDRRLREFLRRHRDLSSADFVGELVLDLDRYRGTAEIRDDTTIVTFKVL